jgi:replicative DNA helicase
MSDKPRQPRTSAGLPPPFALDRLPPQSIESEQGVLGSILLDARTALPEVQQIFRGAEAFYDLRHQVIYDAICALASENKPVEIIGLVEKLRADNQLEAVGGTTYLSSLPDVSPSAANVSYFAEMVEEKAALRRLIQTCTAAIQRAYDDPNHVEAVISEAEQGILRVRRQRADKTPSMSTLVHDAIAEIERLHQQQGAISGIPTGLSDLDKLTDGMHGGEMIVIAGYPGAGKSAIAMNIAENAAVEQKLPVGVFSLEMKAKRLVLRMLASRGRVNLRNIRDGYLAERDFPKLTAAAAKLSRANMHFSDLSDMTISEMRAKARQMVQQHGIKLFVLDYIQLVTAPGEKDQNREREVATISRGIKQMALEFDVPVIALSQLNEEGKMRESRAIGQDADTVWILKAEENSDPDAEALPVSLEIKKQRDGQAPAIVHLTFFKSFVKFESATRQSHWSDKLP